MPPSLTASSPRLSVAISASDSPNLPTASFLTFLGGFFSLNIYPYVSTLCLKGKAKISVFLDSAIFTQVFADTA